MSLEIPIYPADKKPIINIMVPRAPNKCMGRLPKRDKNQMVIKSKNPFINLSIPNFVSPYFRAWCCTIFSPILLKPAFFANTGI